MGKGMGCACVCMLLLGGLAPQCDVDQCPEISGACGISSMPTFILFARGTEIGRTTGADASKLRDMLQRATYVL